MGAASPRCVSGSKSCKSLVSIWEWELLVLCVVDLRVGAASPWCGSGSRSCKVLGVDLGAGTASIVLFTPQSCKSARRYGTKNWSRQPASGSGNCLHLLAELRDMCVALTAE